MTSQPSPHTWDFIVVGSGPAGSTLASKLASTASTPAILLLEAGPQKDAKSLRVDGQRWTTFQRPDMNWGYKTTAQENCNGREIDYSRGKVLGGGSAINFGIYTVGARDDYDKWAELVGDEMFNWENMQGRFKELECFTGEIRDERYRHFATPKVEDHGRAGKLKVGYPVELDEDVPLVMEAFQEAGLQANLDHNSGDPIGISLGINSAFQGVRVTAGDLLVDKPRNLEIQTEKTVTRVVFEDDRAVGVEVDGEIFLANKEVILCAGSLDTPRILMHSGIGPPAQLSAFNIPLLFPLPAIGQGLRDHPFAPLCLARAPNTNTRNAFYSNTTAMDTAMTQWQQDGTGPWSKHATQLVMGWLKSPGTLGSKEFANLDEETREFLTRPTIPHYEIASHFPIHMLVPGLITDYSYLCLAVFLMNGQSRGEVTLQSADPTVPLLFNPNLLSHPYDRRVCVEGYKELLAVTRHPSFAKDTVSTILGPASESDEDILAFWRDTVGTAWHMTGTVKMGKAGGEEEKDAAVDSSFRVFGVKGLRVADMSVVPVLTNNHTQATAYVVGGTCADVLIAEYGLDRISR
ncbi:hypothetical protein BDW59DRAFT_181040 [Aspergillus cavernicola]|uniref:Glucose-methanol-choline oxidoreductase N-terminal domain-containing protein n=1 Tax=Aspergillus cavernicola TaxID=176166 RepID=A0ABR4IY14_9EURO